MVRSSESYTSLAELTTVTVYRDVNSVVSLFHVLLSYFTMLTVVDSLQAIE